MTHRDPSAPLSKASWIERAFPTPRMFDLADVSIDISDGTLRYFEVSRAKGGLKPKAWGSLPFPRVNLGAKEDREEKPGEAEAALKAFASSKGYRSARGVVHEGDAYAFKLKVPTLAPAELRPAIESALEENVPIPPGEAIFEYEVVSVDQARRETTVAVSVLSERVVSAYFRLFESAGILPVSFDTESRAAARALFSPGDEGTHACLVVREHHSVVFVVEKGRVTFSSSIEVGSYDLERAVEKTFSIAPDKARAAMSGGKGAPEIEDSALFESMIPVFATIHDELGKVIAYFRAEASKAGGEGQEISDVVLAGSDSRIPGFARYISLSTKLPARYGSVWTNVLSPEKDVPELDERSSLDYAPLIGAHL